MTVLNQAQAPDYEIYYRDNLLKLLGFLSYKYDLSTEDKRLDKIVDEVIELMSK